MELRAQRIAEGIQKNFLYMSTCLMKTDGMLNQTERAFENLEELMPKDKQAWKSLKGKLPNKKEVTRLRDDMLSLSERLKRLANKLPREK